LISKLRGKLVQVHDQVALVENGGLFYEVQLPSALAERLKNEKVEHEITFETIYYIEAGDRKSNHFPRLIGFTNQIDREFFSLFTQVPGMGMKKALKSLIVPIKEIAAAIESKDASVLNRLPGVGGRLAEKIIAELNGKTAKFALSKEDEALASAERRPQPLAEEAMEILTQLQYGKADALRMIEEALKVSPGIKQVEQLITEIFRNEQQVRADAT
jgi:Holliday junction DNA helicase RuvA